MTTDTAPRLALITGGSRGLGRAGALALAAAGTDILLTYRTRSDEADAVVAAVQATGRKAAALPLDLEDTGSFPGFAQSVAALLPERFGRSDIDILINNGGMGLHAPIAETTEAQFDALLAVHVKGTFFLTQALLPTVRDGGRILNLSSGLTRFSLPGYAAYAAAKGAVEVLTRYMAKELGARRIAVNTLAPGAIETDFGGGAVRDNPEYNRRVAEATALGRAGLPEDIGGAIVAILAPGNGWLDGQRIEVSGGVNL